MIPVFERAKTLDALDRAAAVIGIIQLTNLILQQNRTLGVTSVMLHTAT
jgi:hypothetical protein